MSTAVVVLAAGASTRLGSCKALVSIGEHCAFEHLLRALRSWSAEPVHIVTGPHHEAIQAAFGARAVLIENPRWAEGRSGSVQAAVRALPGRDLCLAPVGCPLVPAEVFVALERCWREAGRPARAWLAPCTGTGSERRDGHPLWIGRALAHELMSLAPSDSLRALRARAEPRLHLALDCFAIHDALSTPADLERLRARVAARAAPPPGGRESSSGPPPS